MNEEQKDDFPEQIQMAGEPLEEIKDKLKAVQDLGDQITALQTQHERLVKRAEAAEVDLEEVVERYYPLTSKQHYTIDTNDWTLNKCPNCKGKIRQNPLERLFKDLFGRQPPFGP